ncbi:1 like protein [Argiope bruennichi]|uniref:1 like protein n=1 Tax=Argiope bruennichi TaxID=94029 RepID=A0A8T0EAS7_ARGBR|nr:1 like protein [Argiope bruennichi]
MSSADSMDVEVPDIENLLKLDPYLKPHEKEIRRRYGCFKSLYDKINEYEGGLVEFCRSYKHFGIHVTENNGIRCREWAPGAEAVYLRGDFNDWKRVSYPFKKLDFGKWELEIPPNPDGSCPIPHNSNIKLVILTPNGKMEDRLSPWATYVVQPEKAVLYDQRFWNPPPNERYIFKHPKPKRPDNFKIYECHVGVSGEEESIASYSHFSKNIIPRIKKQGLYCFCFVYLMHVILLCGRWRGEHPLWGSRLFDYSQWEVIRFLLSNLCWYIDEYQFDGFRFDGVTSMLYHHHGIGSGFSGDYNEYFGLATDTQHDLFIGESYCKTLYPECVTIAEDVSGMPALCRPVSEGGGGFDYRLGMAIPDKWIELLKETQDEDWNMGNIVFTLTNRRWMEKTVAYAESHDQVSLLDSDAEEFGGHKRLDHNTEFFTFPESYCGRENSMHIYIPSRVAAVYALAD